MRRKAIVSFSLLLFFLLALVPMVQGTDGTTTITLNPIADQVVDETGVLLPGSSGIHCRADILTVYRSYLKFDLSGISDFNSIIGAELNLYCEVATVPPATVDVSVHKTADLLNDGTTPWTENNLIWSNAPALADLIATTAVGNKGSWYGWNGPAMTDYVKTECAGDKVISFAMKLTVENTSITTVPFHRDFSDRTRKLPPQLIITFASPMTISGHKFNDLNGDGVKDADEPGLSGWTIVLDGYDAITNTPVHLATTTDANGYYEFKGLTAGTYTVSEDLKSGWIQTKPGTYTVVITSATDSENNNFLNFKLVYITADKFDDVNGNGIKDDGEPEIAGWKLTITCPNGTTNTMDSPASWVVRQGGKYTITEADRCGWVHTTASSVSVTVQSGSTPSTIWFGNRHSCSWISDTCDQSIVKECKIDFRHCKGTYKISSTNPGEFYFNVLYCTCADPTTIRYTLTNNGKCDFVTKGSMPVHAYVWNDLNKDGKIDYWRELIDITDKITTAQGPELTGGTIRVNRVHAYNKNILITIHVTLALKGTSSYDLNGAKAFEGMPYTFIADDGSCTKATLTAHVSLEDG